MSLARHLSSVRLGQDDAGASSALAFIVAGIMFLAAVTVLIVTANDKVPPEGQAADRGSRQEAEALLSLLTESPGFGWDDADAHWVNTGGDGPHAGYRPSLVTENGSLELRRWHSWQPSCPPAPPGPPVFGCCPPPTAPNTCVTYLNARKLFGLEPSAGKVFDFHLTVRELTDTGAGTFDKLAFTMGPAPPSGSGETSAAAASTFVRWDEPTSPPGTFVPHTYEITVFVFRTCDPTIPCDP